MEVGTLVCSSPHGTGIVVKDLVGDAKLVEWSSGKVSVITTEWVSQSVYRQTREKKYKKVKIWKVAGVEKTSFVHILSEVKR